MPKLIAMIKAPYCMLIFLPSLPIVKEPTTPPIIFEMAITKVTVDPLPLILSNILVEKKIRKLIPLSCCMIFKKQQVKNLYLYVGEIIAPRVGFSLACAFLKSAIT
jgi:hypothetical protein